MVRKIKDFLFNNGSAKQTVAKNTVWLSISNFGSKIIKAVIVIYAARVLGTSEYGVFSYAVTLAGFLSLFMDPGVNGILTRDAAKADERERREIFSTTLVIKAILLALGIGIIMFAAPIFSTLPGADALLPAVALILTFDTFREFFFSLTRAMEKMEWEAGIFIFTNIAIVVLGFVFLHYAPTAKSFSWGYAIGDGIGVVLALIVLRKYFSRIFSYFAPGRILPILNAAWPFAVSGTLGLLFTNTDLLIISWMRSASDVGVYSAVLRIIQTFYLIPNVIQMSTLPFLARAAKADPTKFRAGLERTLSLVFFVSVPLSIGGIILGTPVMTLVFGQAYAAGGLTFKILMGTLMFDFAATIVINALFAYEHQRSLIISSALGGVVNVGMDLLLIPTFGIAGSGVATLIAQIVNNSYLWYAMKKVNRFEVLPRLGKIVVASAVMGAVCIALYATGVNVVINAFVCCVLYLALLALMKEPILKEARAIALGMR